MMIYVCGLMAILAVGCVTAIALTINHLYNDSCPDCYYVKETSNDFELMSREEWDAKPPKLVENMTNPVPFVIIHHSYQPPACNTTEQCIEAMQKMQSYHQDVRGWNDIGYSFAVGGDGKAYIGRGWSAVGAHAPGYNTQSIGICVIGDWRYELPPENQLETTKKLIEYGISLGMIVPDYTLYGHRQVRDTECPGDRFFAEITTWEHFSEITDEKNRNIVPT